MSSLSQAKVLSVKPLVGAVVNSEKCLNDVTDGSPQENKDARWLNIVQY